MTLRRALVWLGWTGIGVVLVLAVFLAAGPLEFRDFRAELNATIWGCIGFSMCVGLLFLSRIRKGDSGWDITGKVVAAIVMPSIFLILSGMIGWGGAMCAWTESRTLFVNGEDPDQRIVLRDFGCGATDSSPPVKKVFVVDTFNSWFISAHQIDTTTIDKTQWQRVNTDR